jgi:hypothetical protein
MSKQTKPKKKGVRQSLCIFTIVSEEQAVELLKDSLTIAEEKVLLTKALKLEVYPEQIRFIIVDLFHRLVDFGKRGGRAWDPRKLSALLGLVHVAFTTATKKRMAQDAFYDLLKELLLIHCVQRPPHSLCVFSAEEVKEIAAMLVDDVYKPYPLYQYIIQPRFEFNLGFDRLFKVALPLEARIEREAKEIKPLEVPDLRPYIHISEAEAKAESKAKEIEEVLRIAKEKINKELEAKMKLQDDDFLKLAQTLEHK